jgi:CBS domain protein
VAATVKEVMNAELFSLRLTDTTSMALEGILALGISAAPVLDRVGRPLGMVSWRDLVGSPPDVRVADRMSAPAVVIPEDARVADAARRIGETGHRHLVVVEATGRAVGMVSSIDLVRALVGLPAVHPRAFPHFDVSSGLTWTDDQELDERNVPAAPDGPGVLLLLHDAPGTFRRIAWVESAHNVQTRLLDLLSLPQESPDLARLLDHRPHLRFRAAFVGAPDRADAVAARLENARRQDNRATPLGRRQGRHA